ncbi:FxLYD domain-containing protein [Streptomyces sp. NPDC055189]
MSNRDTTPHRLREPGAPQQHDAPQRGETGDRLLPPRRQRNPWKWAALGCGGVIILAFGSCAVLTGAVVNEADKEIQKSSAAKPGDQAKEASGANDKLKDVRLGEPSTDGLGLPQAEVVITNNSSQTSNYLVSVEFLDANGKRIGANTSVASADGVRPGQSVTAKTSCGEEHSGKITTKVTEVHRYAS